MHTITAEKLNEIDPISGDSLAYQLASDAEGRATLLSLAQGGVYINAAILNSVSKSGKSIAYLLTLDSLGKNLFGIMTKANILVTSETLNFLMPECFKESVALNLSMDKEGIEILEILATKNVRIDANTLNKIVQSRGYTTSVAHELSGTNKGIKILLDLVNCGVRISANTLNFGNIYKRYNMISMPEKFNFSMHCMPGWLACYTDGIKILEDLTSNNIHITTSMLNCYFGAFTESVAYKLACTPEGCKLLHRLARIGVNITKQTLNTVIQQGVNAGQTLAYILAMTVEGCKVLEEIFGLIGITPKILKEISELPGGYSQKICLFFSIMQNQEDLVKSLINKKVDVNAVLSSTVCPNQTVVTLAIRCRRDAILDLLLNSNQVFFDLNEPIEYTIDTTGEIKYKLMEIFTNMSVLEPTLEPHDKLEKMKYLVCLARKFYLHYGVDFPARHMSLLLAGHIDGFKRNDVYVDSLNANEVEESIKSEDQEKFEGLMGQIKAKYLEEHQGDVLSQTENKPITTQFNISKNQEENSEPMVLPCKTSAIKPR